MKHLNYFKTKEEKLDFIKEAHSNEGSYRPMVVLVDDETTSSSKIMFYPHRYMKFTMNITQEMLDEFNSTSGYSEHVNGYITLCSDGYLYESYKVNGVEHAQPLEQHETPYGPVNGDYTNISVINDITMIRDCYFIFETPLTSDSGVMLNEEVIFPETPEFDYYFTQTDEATYKVNPNAWGYMVKACESLGYVPFVDIDFNPISYKIQYYSGGVPRVITHPIEVGEINIKGKISSSFYMETEEQTYICDGPLSECYEFNGFSGYTITPTEPKDIEYHGSGDYIVVHPKRFFNFDSVEFPKEIKYIPKNAFPEARMKSIIIPEGVEYIGAHAFSNCHMEYIHLPNSVRIIENSAFAYPQNCKVSVPNNLEHYEDDIFGYYNHNGFEYFDYKEVNGEVYLGKVYAKNKNNQSEVVIKEGTVSISRFAFRECYNITSVTIPNSVTSIDDYAFYDCPNLTTMNVDSEVVLGNLTLKYQLTSLNIGNSVTSIGVGAFHSCSGLTEIIIPDSVTTIGNNAFYGCTSLTEIVIPDSVTSIDNYAFAYCESLTSVTIPDSVTKLEYALFEGSTSLTEIVCYATIAPRLDIDVFSSISPNGVLKVPSGSDYSGWLSALPSGWTIEYMS